MKHFAAVMGSCVLITTVLLLGWTWGRVYQERYPNSAIVPFGSEEKGIVVYDPNDPIYKFVPKAPEDWITRFGASERTRLIHAVSELRVVVLAQNKLLQELKTWHDTQIVVDPNHILEGSKDE